jgi:uncharacterized protein YqeY
MTIPQTIRVDMESALRSGDKLRLEVLRSVLAGFTNQLVAEKRPPQETLTDNEAEAVITRLAKQRRDSIEQFTAGNRLDLAEKEAKELEILNEYLPKMMERDTIKPLAEAKKAELGIQDKSEMGKLMGILMKELKGKAQGDDVRAVVEELFS